MSAPSSQPSVVSAERRSAVDELMRQIKQKSFERLQLQPGQRILDVGCGAGADTLAMARAVGAGGVVHGVDYDATVVAQARQLSRTQDASAWLTYHHANVTALPWQDDYFNACRCDRIFQNLLEPEQAFDELLRVTRPGGVVVVISGDWATLSIDSDEPDIESRHAHFVATLSTDDKISGRSLRSLFAQRGMLDVQIEVHPVLPASTEAGACWQRSIEPAAAKSGLFGSANVVLISGRKPVVSE